MQTGFRSNPWISGRRLRSALFAAALAAGLSGMAQASVEKSAADGFLVVNSIETGVSPLHAYLAITQPAKWWMSEHTWSGDAANLSMDARAGGCFCEKWKRGSVEHLRVVWATAPSELRLRGGLGPLQGMGVEGLLTIEIAPQAAGATIRMSYRVSGDSLQSLTALAPVVDGVLAAQLAGLKQLLDGPAPGSLRD